jgi:hypothetical protein
MCSEKRKLRAKGNPACIQRFSLVRVPSHRQLSLFRQTVHSTGEQRVASAWPSG